MLSLAGLVIVIMEVIVGLALGFALQIGFAAAMLGGELISNSMGLGFAALANPLGGPATPAISQLLSMLALFLFLGLDGHLMLAGFIVDSYRTLPVGDAWLAADTLRRIAGFGSLVFASGLAVALPVGFALVLVQVVMAFIARSAPTLNLFAVGLPATLAAGLLLMAAAMPVIADAIADGIRQGLDEAGRIARHG